MNDVINEFVNSNETIPWYLQANSTQDLNNRLGFSNIRSRLQEKNEENLEIFAAKLSSNPNYDAFEKDIGIVSVFFPKNKEKVL